MGKIVSARRYIHAAVNKSMGTLGSHNGIEHHGEISTGRIFHSHRYIHTTCCQAVLLILYRTGSDRLVGKDIVKVTPVLRIEHFVRCCQSTLFDSTGMHFPDGNDTCQKIRRLIRLRLMQHSLIPLSCCPRFIRIDPGNDHEPVRNLLIYFGKAIHILADRIFIICRTRSYNYNKFI